MRKGSITVFLSLILVLLFSFILTTLEAARIRGATAYTSMITELAGESFLASYYYPLFKHYRLLGVNAGNREGFFSEEAILKNIRQDVKYGLEEQSGALLRFENTEVKIEAYQTMLSEGETELLKQIRQQTVLDGATRLLDGVFPAEQLTEAGAVGQAYLWQEEALKATATVTEEILLLMEQVDGIKMSSHGIAFDRNGRLQANSAFIKQILPMDQRPIRESYGNEEVYSAVAGKFYRVDQAAAKMLDYTGRIAVLNQRIRESNRRIEMLKSIEETEEVKVALGQEKSVLTDYISQKRMLLETAEKEYNRIVQHIRGVTKVIGQSLETVEILEEKQQKAGTTIEAYELFLEGMEQKLSEEIYSVFEKELERMKVYTGMEEKGFSVKTVRESLLTNYTIVSGFSLEGFSEKQLKRVENEMKIVISGMKEYITRGLWFTYGDIVVAEGTWENVMGSLSELLTAGIFPLVGISKEEVSDFRLSGTELPSDGLERSALSEELTACLEKVAELLQSGVTEAAYMAGNVAADGTVLELYCRNYFHTYNEESPDTKLKYEREYIVFGAKEDKSNLLTMILHLIAIRTLLCMVTILKQPDRLYALEALGTSVTGFTGMPVLAVVVKYAVMLLWAVEEALIEVAGLLQGKRVAAVGTGMVAFEELFLVNQKIIAQKAGQLPEGSGAAYEDYLSLFSLTRGTINRAYRILDLIQENLRLRYNNGFRMRNVVTELDFSLQTHVRVLFDTGAFPENVYKITGREKRAY